MSRSSSVVQYELGVGDAAILPAMLRATDEVGSAVNLKTAKAFGLTIPTSLLPRADQVIE
jgi:hypothetical protein